MKKNDNNDSPSSGEAVRKVSFLVPKNGLHVEALRLSQGHKDVILQQAFVDVEETEEHTWPRRVSRGLPGS